MALKTNLDALTMETAVLGGAVLGRGGGGKLEDGLYLGELATAQEGACLVEPATLFDQATVAAVMTVHTSGSDTHQIHPRQGHLALEMLQSELEITVEGLVNGGQGAVDSIIGWELSGFLGVPLLNRGIPATFHPVPLCNLLKLWQDTAAMENFIVSLVGRFDKGRGHREHLWQGCPAELQRRLAGFPVTERESYVAAAGPLPVTALVKDGRDSLVSLTLQVGQALLAVNDNGGGVTVKALQDILSCQFSTFATVTEISWHGQGQDTSGHIEMRDVDNRHLELMYNQRYRELTVDGRRTAAFPDLIITLGILGTPLTGEEVFIGQDLYLIVASHKE